MNEPTRGNWSVANLERERLRLREGNDRLEEKVGGKTTDVELSLCQEWCDRN